MATATLAELFGNHEVFKRNIKIRRGLAAVLIYKATDYEQVLTIFKDMAISIFSKLSLDDPNGPAQVLQLRKILEIGNATKLVDFEPIVDESEESSMLGPIHIYKS